ncbi:hypothetical protein Bca4012_085569 [Brassica carinata]|uniref:KIB1-4 beta-propeller domain-containing protein n=1 Tax=Brassica carinata TaxID=52824 RepID=A0A8X7QM49_BRACI|nr:hypothetical protein Bca52824_067173 [Brassica carinata]
MSQLCSRISKLSSPLNRRRFSTTPYLYLGREVVGESPCGGNVVNFNLYDPRKEEQVVIENQTLSKHLRDSKRIGSSRGWLAMMNKHDSTVRLTDILNNPSKTISLPPLIKDETERLINVSVSSSDHGCVVVAARSDGSRLSLCRVGDSEWTRVDLPCPAFRLSQVMYSDRDRKFYVNSCISDYTGPTEYGPVNAYVRYPLSNSPKLDLRRLNIHQLFVQSPSGESFIVLWGLDCMTDKGEAVEWKDKMSNQRDLFIKTRNIMVYRQDTEKGIGPYTRDIGDLCIFVGENEPFCLSASDYPGLKPNSVYFAGRGSGYGICDLASSTISYLSDSPIRHPLYWIPPQK